jgi:hypothetical protein
MDEEKDVSPFFLSLILGPKCRGRKFSSLGNLRTIYTDLTLLYANIATKRFITEKKFKTKH